VLDVYETFRYGGFNLGHCDIQVWIENAVTLQEWPPVESLARMDSASMSRFLHIRAWTFELRFEQFDYRSVTAFRIIFPSVSPVGVVPFYDNWTRRLILSKEAAEGSDFLHKLLADSFLGIVIDIDSVGKSCTLLVVESFKGHVERIGLSGLSFQHEVFDVCTGTIVRKCGSR
jgi:hypothetical protein